MIRAVGNSLRVWLSYSLLLLLRAISILFYRTRVRWVGESADGPVDLVDVGKSLRIVAILNHTSLFEWLFVAAAPVGFLYRVAKHAAIPVADKTIARPLTGLFFKLLTANIIPVTRTADSTWKQVVDAMGADNMVVILPEGRMKRANGLDRDGRPMTVRGGIADLISVADAVPGSGKMLLAYSAGLHHIQVPGQRFPKLFKTIDLALEVVDLNAYRAQRSAEPGSQEFKIEVIVDLTERRDRYCVPPEGR